MTVHSEPTNRDKTGCNIRSHEWSYTHRSRVRYIAISPLYPHCFPSAVQNERWRKGGETKGRLGGICPTIYAHVLILITRLLGLRGTENQSGDLQIPLKKHRHGWRWSPICRISTSISRRGHAARVCANAESHYFSPITASKLYQTGYAIHLNVPLRCRSIIK
jgi:hypothetical protein